MVFNNASSCVVSVIKDGQVLYELENILNCNQDGSYLYVGILLRLK